MDGLIFHGYVEIKAPPPPPPEPEVPRVNPYGPVEFREGTIENAMRGMNPKSMMYRVLDWLQRR